MLLSSLDSNVLRGLTGALALFLASAVEGGRHSLPPQPAASARGQCPRTLALPVQPHAAAALYAWSIAARNLGVNVISAAA